MNIILIAIIYTSLLPVVLFLIYVIVKNIKRIKQFKKIEIISDITIPTKTKHKTIMNQDNIQLTWSPPRGKNNLPYYQLVATNVYKADKGRQISSTSLNTRAFGIGGSRSQRNIKTDANWTEKGPAEIVFTYVDVWIRGELINYRYKLNEIEEMKISSYGDLLIKLRQKAWPFRLQMTKEDILLFSNLVHTINKISKSNSGWKKKLSADKAKKDKKAKIMNKSKKELELTVTATAEAMLDD